MERGGKLYYNAPCMVMVPIDPKGMSAVIDCGILCQNIALAAASLDLGSCICGLAGTAFVGDRATEFKKRLNFPDGYEFGMAVLIGYAEKASAPHEPDHSKIRYIE